MDNSFEIQLIILETRILEIEMFIINNIVTVEIVEENRMTIY